MNEQWLQLKSLVGLDGLPKTIQGITQKAKSEKWIRRRVVGVKGRIYEYSINSLPETIINNLSNSNLPGDDDRIKNLKDRLMAALQNKNYTLGDLSEKTAIPIVTLETYLEGKITPALEKLVVIADALNCPFEWLAIGSQQTASKNNNYVLIPKFSWSSIKEDINLNPLNVSQNEENDHECIFSKAWLAKNGLETAQLATIEMQGDSMETTISDGDTVLINLTEKDLNNVVDGIFVLLIDDHVMIKRVQYDLVKKGYHIYSDNTAYQSFFIAPGDENNLKIIAKVEKVLRKPAQTSKNH